MARGPWCVPAWDSERAALQARAVWLTDPAVERACLLDGGRAEVVQVVPGSAGDSSFCRVRRWGVSVVDVSSRVLRGWLPWSGITLDDLQAGPVGAGRWATLEEAAAAARAWVSWLPSDPWVVSAERLPF